MNMIFLYLSVIENHENDDKFMSLYYKYEKKVFNIAYGFTKDFHDAEDASQAAFFAIARNIGKINTDDEAKTKIYVYKSVKCACFDILRKRSRMPQCVSMDSFFDLSAEEDIKQRIENDEVTEKLLETIKGIPEIYRDVLSYHYLAGYSVSVIADMLHRPLPTVKSQLSRGNKLLKTAIKEARIYD